MEYPLLDGMPLLCIPLFQKPKNDQIRGRKDGKQNKRAGVRRVEAGPLHNSEQRVATE